MRNAFALTASLLFVGTASLPAHAQWSNYGYNGSDGDIVRCESRDGRTSRCNAYSGDAQLVRQLSDTACIRNRNWGIDYQGLWVSGGCRAEFRVLSNYNDGYYGSDYGYDNGYYGNDYGYGSSYGSSYGNSYGYGSDGVFRCESKDGRTAHCNSYGGARLVRQVSDSPCIQGRTWGTDSRGVWVSGGCRAIFQSGYGNGNYGNGGYGNAIVRCESVDNRSRTCNLNAGRRGDVRIVRQLSGKPCIEGRTWGYSGSSVWVTQGCRAEFAVTRNGNRGNGGWQRPPGDLGDSRPPGAYLDGRQDARSPTQQRIESPAPGMPGGDRSAQAPRPPADLPPPGQIERPREQPAPRAVVARASQPAQVASSGERPGATAVQAETPAPAERPRPPERQGRTGEPGQVVP